MYTRLTTKLMNDNVIQTLVSNKSRLNDLQEQISTGKRISRASDDPSAAINVLSAKLFINKNEGYLKNINYAESELNMTEKAVQNIVDVIHRAKELTVQASNATAGDSQLDSINAEIEQLINQVKDLGNTQFGSKYIFGGLITEGAPFTQNATGDILYTGTPSTGTYERNTEISEGVNITVNLAGDAIFGQYNSGDVTQQTGLINTLKTLSNELKATTPDYNVIRSKIDALDTDLSNVLNAQSSVGGLISRIQMTKNKIEDDNITFAKYQSEAEDIDFAKTISDLNFQQTALQASLKVGAQVIQSSLLNYM